MPKLKMPKSHFWTSKSGRAASVVKQAKKCLKAKIPQDPIFVESFVRSSPTLQRVLEDDGFELEEADLEIEAETLRDALGGSDKVKAESGESKYKSFSFEPDVLPDTEDNNIESDRNRIAAPTAPREGFAPTFFQIERQELPTVLSHYAGHHSIVHGPDHICRSLILALAMAKFYRQNGQPGFEPGDTAPRAYRYPDDPDRVRAGREGLPKPGDANIDIATIAFAVAFHDSGRTQDGRDKWEHESGRNGFYYLKKLGYSTAYAGNVAKIIVKNEETQGGNLVIDVSRRQSEAQDRGHRNTLNRVPAPLPPNRPFGINEMIVHDADTLEIHRELLTRGGEFKTERLHFLKCTRFDQNLPGNLDRDAIRNELIRDAKDLSQLTVLKQTEARKQERQPILPRFMKYVGKNVDFEALFKEFERFIIDKIFENHDVYPFLYKYYFEKCFDPACAELKKLNSEQRLAVIRARLHSKERENRDKQWAEHTFASQAGYNLKQMTDQILNAPLTININYPIWQYILDGIGEDPDPLYKQYWEVIWKPNRPRPAGGGAGNDPATRDAVERKKLNYQTVYTDPGFRAICHERPNYAGVNAAKVKTGAVTKYGLTAIYLKPHILPRITYTFRDTFGKEVFPDAVCAPIAPLSLFREVKDLTGFDPKLFQCIGARLNCDATPQAKAYFKAAKDNAQGMYVEAQIHGPIKWKEDVRAIVIEATTTDGSLDERIRQLTKKHKIVLAFSAKGVDEVYDTRELASQASKNPDHLPQAQHPDIDSLPQQQPQQQPVVPPQRPALEPVRPQPPPRQQHSCPYFVPNPWKRTLCKNCMSTPGSSSCRDYQKSERKVIRQ